MGQILADFDANEPGLASAEDLRGLATIHRALRWKWTMRLISSGATLVSA